MKHISLTRKGDLWLYGQSPQKNELDNIKLFMC